MENLNLVLNLKSWSLRAYRDFANATKNGDFDAVLSSVSKLVESWSLPGDPKSLDYWLDGLTLQDWQTVMQEVTKKLTEEFNSPKK